MQELSLAVVGIDFPNADGGNRRSELMLADPGDPVELRHEPKNKHDPHAVAVSSKNGTQVGYITAERAPWVGSKIGDGYEAVFQSLDTHAAYIRIRFGGGAPTLPEPSSPRRATPPGQHHDPGAFYPDEDSGDWGA